MSFGHRVIVGVASVPTKRGERVNATVMDGWSEIKVGSAEDAHALMTALHEMGRAMVKTLPTVREKMQALGAGQLVRRDRR